MWELSWPILDMRGVLRPDGAGAGEGRLEAQLAAHPLTSLQSLRMRRADLSSFPASSPAARSLAGLCTLDLSNNR